MIEQYAPARGAGGAGTALRAAVLMAVQRCTPPPVRFGFGAILGSVPRVTAIPAMAAPFPSDLTPVRRAREAWMRWEKHHA